MITEDTYANNWMIAYINYMNKPDGYNYPNSTSKEAVNFANAAMHLLKKSLKSNNSDFIKNERKKTTNVVKKKI